MQKQDSITHTIYVRVRDRKLNKGSKRFLAVSVPTLNIEPGELVEWKVANGGGVFDIHFNKEEMDASPFENDVTLTKTGAGALRVKAGTEGKIFAYSVYPQGEPDSLYLDPSLVVEKP